MAEAMLKKSNYAQAVINDERTRQDAEETEQRQKQKAENYEKRKNNTYIFYNLMTNEDVTETIIKDLERYFDLPARNFILKLYRDTRFRSRYCVTFTDERFFNKLFFEGATINGVCIRGQNDKRKHFIKKPVARYYIPNLPGGVTEEVVADLLSDVQGVTYIKQKFSQHHFIAIGGFHVGIIYNHGEEEFLDDFDIEFEGESFRAVCIDKPRQRRQPSCHVANEGENSGTDQDQDSERENKENDRAEQSDQDNNSQADDQQSRVEEPIQATEDQADEQTGRAEESNKADNDHANTNKTNINRADDQRTHAVDKVKGKSNQKNNDQNEQAHSKQPLSMSPDQKQRYDFLISKGSKVSSKELEERNHLMNLETAIQFSQPTTNVEVENSTQEVFPLNCQEDMEVVLDYLDTHTFDDEEGSTSSVSNKRKVFDLQMENPDTLQEQNSKKKKNL